ncbi:uncharacterized protein FFFS_14876 [Fusarium fujikuroi]|nr:uncharacterized protein FFFS_14876 [Fusarium fujikuroi]
MAQLGQDSG